QAILPKECESEITCSKCNSDRHPTLLHKEKDGEELKSNCNLCLQKGRCVLQEEVRLPNDRNPADLETRGLHPSKMMESVWLNGPTFLRNTAEVPPSNEVMSTNDSDPEVRKEAISCKTKIGNSQSSGLGAERFKRFSSLSSCDAHWQNLIVKLREFKLRKERPATKPTIPGCNVPGSQRQVLD
ncbi:hypothetical protein QZH41_009268, partial [Actinostola sp. cb2023]